MMTTNYVSPSSLEMEAANLRKMAEGAEISPFMLRAAAASLDCFREMISEKSWADEQAKRRADLDKQQEVAK
jgi:hypothetical protein